MTDKAIPDPDNPEWTTEDFSSARPASEVLSPDVARLLMRQGRSARSSVALCGQDKLARGWSLAA